MEAVKLPKLRLRKANKSFFTEKHLVKQIISEIQNFPDYLELKFTNRVVEIVLEFLIRALPKKVSKSRPIDIPKVALHILKVLFDITKPDEIKIVEGQVEDFYQNKRVKRDTLIGSIFNAIKELFLKK